MPISIDQWRVCIGLFYGHMYGLVSKSKQFFFWTLEMTDTKHLFFFVLFVMLLILKDSDVYKTRT